MKSLVAAVAVLVALVAGAPVQAQPPDPLEFWLVLADPGRVDGGDDHAQFNIGLIYVGGSFGVQQDDTEAVRWFQLAAEQGHARAQYFLGGMYGEGRGVPQDYAGSGGGRDRPAVGYCGSCRTAGSD